jgi:hypothetical protein
MGDLDSPPSYALNASMSESQQPAPEEAAKPLAGATEKLGSFRKVIEHWWWLGVTILAVVGGVAGVYVKIRGWAQSAVLDEKFLQTLAVRVRPTCFFDDHGTVESDLGALEYISELHVTKKGHGFEIWLKSKQHLANPPLVTGTDVSLFQQAASRTNLTEWNILMESKSTYALIAASDDLLPTNQTYHFKLEIFH